MKRTTASALLAVTLTLGHGGIAAAQAPKPKPAPAKAVDPFAAALSAYNRKGYATAARLFRSLAAQGNASAKSNLGSMYANGRGVAQDYKEAVRLFGLAAAQGNASAQYNLGDLPGSFCTKRIDGKGPGAVVSLTLVQNIRQATVALTRARVVVFPVVQAEGFRMAPVAGAILGRVVTAATRGTVLIPIADNAQDIEPRTAAIVPSFSFLAFSLSITPALGSRTGWLAGLI